MYDPSESAPKRHTRGNLILAAILIGLVIIAGIDLWRSPPVQDTVTSPIPWSSHPGRD